MGLLMLKRECWIGDLQQRLTSAYEELHRCKHRFGRHMETQLAGVDGVHFDSTDSVESRRTNEEQALNSVLQDLREHYMSKIKNVEDELQRQVEQNQRLSTLLLRTQADLDESQRHCRRMGDRIRLLEKDLQVAHRAVADGFPNALLDERRHSFPASPLEDNVKPVVTVRSQTVSRPTDAMDPYERSFKLVANASLTRSRQL